MTLNLLDLMDAVSLELDDAHVDPALIQAAHETVLLLRASKALPYKRSSQNGFQHLVLATAFVRAYMAGEAVMLPTRKAQTLFDRGYSTCLTSWLDRCVSTGLLISQSPNGKAFGPLKLGDVLKRFLNTKGINTLTAPISA